MLKLFCLLGSRLKITEERSEVLQRHGASYRPQYREVCLQGAAFRYVLRPMVPGMPGINK